FEARQSEYIDAESGVSSRMAITAFQNLLSTAELRMLKNKETTTSVRLCDFNGIISAITGKDELAYEGEQEGMTAVAMLLIESAIKTLFPTLFPKIEKLEKENERYPYDEIVQWFSDSEGVEIGEGASDADYRQELDQVDPIRRLIEKYQPN